MTREEAIKWIRLDIEMNKFNPTTGEEAYLNEDAKKVIEAQEMAIKTLEQPEIILCENCFYFADTFTAKTIKSDIPLLNLGFCANWGNTTAKNGFCHRAERKE